MKVYILLSPNYTAFSLKHAFSPGISSDLDVLPLVSRLLGLGAVGGSKTVPDIEPSLAPASRANWLAGTNCHRNVYT